MEDDGGIPIVSPVHPELKAAMKKVLLVLKKKNTFKSRKFLTFLILLIRSCIILKKVMESKQKTLTFENFFIHWEFGDVKWMKAAL